MGRRSSTDEDADPRARARAAVGVSHDLHMLTLGAFWCPCARLPLDKVGQESTGGMSHSLVATLTHKGHLRVLRPSSHKRWVQCGITLYIVLLSCTEAVEQLINFIKCKKVECLLLSDDVI